MTDYRITLIARMGVLYGSASEMVTQFTEMCVKWPNRDVYDRALTSIVECHEIENHIKNS